MEIRNLVLALGSMCLLIALAPAGALANGDGTGIAGSPHDFTDDVDHAGDPMDEISGALSWNGKRQEICRTCHVPHDHGSVRYANQGILWNHEVTADTGWTMYNSTNVDLSWIDGTVEAAPAGTSKLCLGCHDGVTAVNYYDGRDAANPPSGTDYGDPFVMGTGGRYDSGFVIGATTASMTNNHPISITYNNGTGPGQDDQLFDPSVATMRNGDTVASLLVGTANRVECSTCHDVHNRESVADTHLLRESTNASAPGGTASGLCFVCHDK